MATWNATNLDNRQLPNSKITIFTAANPTIIRHWHVHNTSGSTTETVIGYFKRATSRVIARVVLAPNEAADLIDESLPVIVLEAGDLIEAQTTNATTVDSDLGGAVFS